MPNLAWATVALLSITALSAGCRGPGIPPDMIMVNGNIITVDAHDRVVQALAIRDGKIVALGASVDIERLAGPQTDRLDLNGLTATPGLLDAHAHFAWGGATRLYVLDLSYPTVRSIGDVVAAVATQLERLGTGGWVRGRGWDEGKLEERRYIYAADLDSVAPRNPVWLTHTMGHYGVANSLALRLAGIDRNTPDPPGGTIDRDPDGRPTGVLKESAQQLVTGLIPDHSAEQVREGIRELAKAFNEEGMTGLKDPGIGFAEWDAYQQVLADGGLTVRVFALWQAGTTTENARELLERIGPFTKPHISTGDDRLISGGIKMYIDGSGGARTAWVYDQWNKDFEGVDEGNVGYPVVPPEGIRERIELFHDAGLHVSVHSIGDRAIDWVVDSYQMVLDENPVAGLRHGIIHANIPTNHALDVMASLQQEYDAGYPEPSATFMWWIGDTYAGNFGAVRAKRLNPFRTYRDRGIRWATGSDYNVTPFPARYGLWASLAREPLLGVYGKDPYSMDEAIDIRTALRSFTIWSAHQMFLEDRIGSLEVGKYADIAVWDLDLYSGTADQIKEMECQLTVLNGRIVYQRPNGGVTVEPAL